MAAVSKSPAHVSRPAARLDPARTKLVRLLERTNGA
jgi:hypothetical protein